MDNTPEPNSQPKPVEQEAPQAAETQNPTTPAPVPTETVTAKKMPAKGLIIGLIVGGVALLAMIIIAICLLVGGEVDYEATYNDLKPLETSMEKIGSNNCYKLNRDVDDDYTSVAKYKQYVDACLTEFEAVETEMNKFAKTSGVKHDENIKKAFENFEAAFKAIYKSKSDMESGLAIYSAYHEFYVTISDSADDADSLEKAINSASQLFEDTKNAKLAEFAKGFRERGLAYVGAIKKFQNSSSYSSSLYDELYDKMEDFVDYIEDNAPEIDEVTDLNFTKMNDLEDAYYDLEDAVSDAYYDSL